MELKVGVGGGGERMCLTLAHRPLPSLTPIQLGSAQKRSQCAADTFSLDSLKTRIQI